MTEPAVPRSAPERPVRETFVEREVDDRDVLEVAHEPRALRWGPIVAGLVTSFSVFVLLSLLAVGIGAGTANADQTTPGTGATLVASVIALASLFLGGFVAAWSAGVTEPSRGALDGFLVWALWFILLLFAGGLGLGALFGEPGSLIDEMQAPDLTRGEILDALSTGAIGTFLALVLAAAAAALGGAVGTRQEVHRAIGRY